ncbi:MAG: MarR family transcriptional regulator [Bacillota bacterium]
MEYEHVGKTIHQLGIMDLKQINHRLKKIDLSMAQGLVLIFLQEANKHELTIKTLEKMSETSQPTMLGVINRLEQKGLIVTYLTEKRKKMVKITEDGLNTIPYIKESIEEVEKIFFCNFTVGEHAIFMELLQKAKNNLFQYHAINKPLEKEKENNDEQ